MFEQFFYLQNIALCSVLNLILLSSLSSIAVADDFPDSRQMGRYIAWTKHLTNESLDNESVPVFDFYRNTEIQMAFPSSAILKIKENCFLNQHQIRATTGVYNPRMRAELEEMLAGLEISRLVQGQKDFPVKELLPKYAYLGMREKLPGFAGSGINPDAHGDVFAVFNDDIKDRSTFTPTDSFGLRDQFFKGYTSDPLMVVHTFLYRPKTLNFTPLEYNGYWEVQIWGKLCVADVQFFLINCGRKKMSPIQINEIKSVGKPIYECDNEKYPGGGLKAGASVYMP